MLDQYRTEILVCTPYVSRKDRNKSFSQEKEDNYFWADTRNWRQAKLSSTASIAATAGEATYINIYTYTQMISARVLLATVVVVGVAAAAAAASEYSSSPPPPPRPTLPHSAAVPTTATTTTGSEDQKAPRSAVLLRRSSSDDDEASPPPAARGVVKPLSVASPPPDDEPRAMEVPDADESEEEEEEEEEEDTTDEAPARAVASPNAVGAITTTCTAAGSDATDDDDAPQPWAPQPIHGAAAAGSDDDGERLEKRGIRTLLSSHLRLALQRTRGEWRYLVTELQQRQRDGNESNQMAWTDTRAALVLRVSLIVVLCTLIALSQQG